VQVVLAQGQILRDAHRFQESFDLLTTALQGSPDEANLLYETAMSAERLDRIDVMEEHLRHLVQLRPDYAHAYNALGYTLADRNIRLKEAYELIDKALQLAPDDGFILDSMGWVQYRMGNLSAARDYLKRAYKLKPEADVAAHLGEVLWTQGDKDAARNLWREASRRESDNETLKETLHAAGRAAVSAHGAALRRPGWGPAALSATLLSGGGCVMRNAACSHRSPELFGQVRGGGVRIRSARFDERTLPADGERVWRDSGPEYAAVAPRWRGSKMARPERA